MIGALVTVLSLSLTATLLNAGIVANTLPITNVTQTTPMTVTSPAHGWPPGRKLHAGISGVTGSSEANGIWQLSVVDADTFALYAFSPQGIKSPSVGVHAYTGGGTIQYAFPDGAILLGRRNVQLASAPVSPRIVMVPTIGRSVDFESYGGPGQAYKDRGTLEQQAEKLAPQVGTDFTTFEVFFSGYANPPDPDFGDFDATQYLSWQFYITSFDANGGRIKVHRTDWPSQTVQSGTQSQRGQQLRWIVEYQQPIAIQPEVFVPLGVTAKITVEPINPGSTDATVITITA